MLNYQKQLHAIPPPERWVIEDKIIVIHNMINRNRFKHKRYDFTNEEIVRKQVITHMKRNGIKSLYEGVLSYRDEVRARISKGEII